MTTFYVRVLTDIFSLNPFTGTGIISSDTGHYKSTYVSSTDWTIENNPDRIFSQVTKIVYYNEFAQSKAAANFPENVVTTSVIDFKIRDGGSTPFLIDTDWADRGWTNPSTDQSTFITEVCTAFVNDNERNVVTLNDNINLLLFRFNFRLSLNTQFYYVPVFYVGNDSNRDFTVVI